MLVVSRKISESVRVGDDVLITVVRCRGGKVRIGIDAPQNMKIMRTELIAETVPGAEPVGSAGRNDCASVPGIVHKGLSHG